MMQARGGASLLLLFSWPCCLDASQQLSSRPPVFGSYPICILAFMTRQLHNSFAYFHSCKAQMTDLGFRMPEMHLQGNRLVKISLFFQGTASHVRIKALRIILHNKLWVVPARNYSVFNLEIHTIVPVMDFLRRLCAQSPVKNTFAAVADRLQMHCLPVEFLRACNGNSIICKHCNCWAARYRPASRHLLSDLCRDFRMCIRWFGRWMLDQSTVCTAP